MTKQQRTTTTSNGNDHVIDNDATPEKRLSTPPLITATARKFLSPYLPPPVVVAIHEVDKRLEPYIGREASMNLLATVLAGMFVMYLVQISINGRHRSPRRAWADEQDEEEEGGPSAWRAAVDYGTTMILCGPSGGGKTTLFYQLCPEALPIGQSLNGLLTLTSLRPNLGLAPNKATSKHHDDGKQNTQPPIRFIDYPGHMSLHDDVFINWLFPKSSSSSAATRVILVVDATQRVNAAAQALYRLLELAGKRQQPSSQSPRLEILIACHKADAPQAKNWRRIKLQMRTELERRFSQKPGMEDTAGMDRKEGNGHSATPWWWPKLNETTTWDLEQLPVAQISFCSSSCQQSMAELLGFCEAPTAAAVSTN